MATSPARPTTRTATRSTSSSSHAVRDAANGRRLRGDEQEYTARNAGGGTDSGDDGERFLRVERALSLSGVARAGGEVALIDGERAHAAHREDERATEAHERSRTCERRLGRRRRRRA